MALTATGIGSGIDIKGLVEQLVAAERQPAANRITSQESRANSQLSALGQLKSALANLRDATESVGTLDTLRQRSVRLDTQDILTATATPAAAAGRYDVEVLQLATNQRLASAAFASADTVVGTGTLNISAGGQSLAVTVNATNNTLAGIRDAINTAAGTTGALRASIVNADGGAYLLLTATGTGLANAITVNAVEPGSALEALEAGAGTTNSLTVQQAATDAQVRIDGLTVTSGSNTIEGAIEGVSFDLAKAEPGTVVGVEVAIDAVAVKTAIKGFVDAYNGVVDTVKRLTAFNPDNRSAAALLGDSQTRSVVAAIRGTLAGNLGGAGNAFGSLVAVGLRSDVSGRLSIDVKALDTALGSDPEALARVFAADSSGLADRLAPVFAGVLDSDGSLASREARLQDRLRDITTDRADLDRRMEAVKRRLERQFNSLDQLVQQLNSSGNFLLRALGQT
jgi:flagellar hook-associated protein 2